MLAEKSRLQTKRPPRILMIAGQPYMASQLNPVGGAGRQAYKLSAALVRKGVSVTYVTDRRGRHCSKRELDSNGFPIVRLSMLWELFGRRARRFGVYTFMTTLSWYLLRHRDEYDLIHVHSATTSTFIGVAVGHRLGKPVIAKVMNSGKRYDLRRLRQNRAIIGTTQMAQTILRCDRIIALNQLIKQELKDDGYPVDRIIHIPNGVEVEGAPCRKSYALGSTVRLIFTGRLVPEKGLDILLEAFAQVMALRPHLDWRLCMLGEGAQRQEYREMAKQMNISDAVQMPGQVPDVTKHLCEADMFLLPSRVEGMPNALLEAMACGLPCIASQVAGNDVLIESHKNGLLVPANDATALAKGILALVDDQLLRQKVGCAARETVEARFSVDDVAEQYLELYQELLRR